jgi:hypothetical protein
MGFVPVQTKGTKAIARGFAASVQQQQDPDERQGGAGQVTGADVDPGPFRAVTQADEQDQGGGGPFGFISGPASAIGGAIGDVASAVGGFAAATAGEALEFGQERAGALFPGARETFEDPRFQEELQNIPLIQLDRFVIRPVGAALSALQQQTIENLIAGLQGKVPEQKVVAAIAAFNATDGTFDERLDAFTDALNLFYGQQFINEVIAGAFLDPLMPIGPLAKVEAALIRGARVVGGDAAHVGATGIAALGVTAVPEGQLARTALGTGALEDVSGTGMFSRSGEFHGPVQGGADFTGPISNYRVRKIPGAKGEALLIEKGAVTYQYRNVVFQLEKHGDGWKIVDVQGAEAPTTVFESRLAALDAADLLADSAHLEAVARIVDPTPDDIDIFFPDVRPRVRWKDPTTAAEAQKQFDETEKIIDNWQSRLEEMDNPDTKAGLKLKDQIGAADEYKNTLEQYIDEVASFKEQAADVAAPPPAAAVARATPDASAAPTPGAAAAPKDITQQYPAIERDATVDGRVIRDPENVPNMGSIESSLDGDYEILPGLREVSLSEFELTGKTYSVQGNERIRNLVEEIEQSGEISPLIVVIDKDGPYILEGATRVEALYNLGAKSFPAKVVIDRSTRVPQLTDEAGVLRNIEELTPSRLAYLKQQGWRTEAQGIPRSTLPTPTPVAAAAPAPVAGDVASLQARIASQEALLEKAKSSTRKSDKLTTRERQGITQSIADLKSQLDDARRGSLERVADDVPEPLPLALDVPPGSRISTAEGLSDVRAAAQSRSARMQARAAARVGTTGDKLLPDLSNEAGIAAEIRRIDDQIKGVVDTTPSAGPPLGTTGRIKRTGAGVGTTIEDLVDERADLVQQFAVMAGRRTGQTPEDLIGFKGVDVLANVPGTTRRAIERVAAQRAGEAEIARKAFEEGVTTRYLEETVRPLLNDLTEELAQVRAATILRQSPSAGSQRIDELTQRIINLAGALSEDSRQFLRFADDLAIEQAEETAAAALRAAPGPQAAPGPRGLQPPPEGGLPSGRVPGGEQNIVPAGPIERVDRWIAKDFPIPNIIRMIRKQLGLSAWYDRNIALAELSKHTGIPVRDLAQIVPGSQGAGEAIIEKFYQRITRTMSNQDIKDLEEWMSLRRMDDILSEGQKRTDDLGFTIVPLLPGGIKGRQGVNLEKDKLIARLGPAKMERINTAAEELWVLNDTHVLQRMQDAGLISKVEAGFLRQSEHYMPFHRVDFVDFVDDVGKAFSSPDASVSSTGLNAKLLEGSERELENPLARFFMGPINAESLIARNRAARSIIEALEQMRRDGMDVALREITEGAKAGENSNLLGTISFFDDGVKRTFEIDARFASVANGLADDPDNMFSTIFKVLNLPKRGLTEFNPAFLPVNMLRDSTGALFREGVVPLSPSIWRALKSAIIKDQDFMDAAQAGVFLSSITDTMGRRVAGVQATPLLGNLAVKSASDAALLIPRLLALPFRTSASWNLAIERTTRIATFTKLKAQGLTDLEAAVRARDVTVDFAKAGNSMKIINQMIPFSNAALQGQANLLRTIKNHPARSTAFAALFTSATIATRMNNERFETSHMIPDYEYLRNWVIQYGEGTRADGTKFPLFISLPKGEIAAQLSVLGELVFSFARDSGSSGPKERILDAAVGVIQTASPVEIPGANVGPVTLPVPLLVEPGFEVATNTKLYTGGTIDPQSEQKLPPEQRFGQRTSTLAVQLGEKFNLSPRKIQIILDDVAGGAGQFANYFVSSALEMLGLRPEEFGEGVSEDPPLTTEEQVSQVPVVGRFLKTSSFGELQRGFEELDDVNRSTKRDFNDISPVLNRLGIDLGEAGTAPVDIFPEEDGGLLALTPQQRARYQQLYFDEAEPIIRIALLTGANLTDKKLAEKLQKRLDTARAEARSVVAREIRRQFIRRELSREQINELAAR